MLLKKMNCCFLLAGLSIALLSIGSLTPRKWGGLKEDCNFEVCVSDTGIHADIVVPIKNKIFDWYHDLSLNEIGSDRVANYNYLSFGWGDRDFYMQTPTWQDLNIITTFRALFLPTPSVMYVQGYRVIPSNMRIKCVKVSRTNYLQLIEFIKDSFQVDTKGSKIRIGNGHRPNAGFYAAKGSYSILRNCNSWAAEGLREADINTPLWDGFSAAIMWHFRSGC